MSHQHNYTLACQKAFEGYSLPSDYNYRDGTRFWTKADAERLVELCKQGLRSFEIAPLFGKSPKAIQKAFRRFRFPSLHNVCPRSGDANPEWKGGVHIGKNGYRYLRRTNHPYANSHGYVFEHRLVVEEHLGRYLSPQEVVHHKDGNPSNNDISNLEVFSSNGQHLRATLAGVRHNMTPEGRKKLSETSKKRWEKWLKLPPEERPINKRRKVDCPSDSTQNTQPIL